MADYDLIIIGSGPGGYVAAVRAAQSGLKTAVIEKEQRLGGVCLNVGCIPSKALLDSSEYYELARNELAAHGIKTGEVTLDLETMMARKEKVVSDLTDSVRSLLENHEIDIIHAKARLEAPGKVAAIDEKKKTTVLEAKNVLLATGSFPVALPGLPFDGRFIVNSDQALAFDNVPKHLGIVGGGYIGLELGSVWRRLGAKVTIIEMLPRIGTGLDGMVARTLDRLLRKQGIEFRLGTTVQNAGIGTQNVTVTMVKNEQTEDMSFDRLLVCVGRRPRTEGLGIEALGIKTDSKSGHLIVDSRYQTNVTGIYAIGDLITGPALAHKASAEGIAAVDILAGRYGEVNYDAIPSVIYTYPEVASVGLTSQKVKERDIPHNVGTYPFSGVGRARCMGKTDGFVKLIAHAKSDRILGVHILGPRAADMIAECVLAMEFGAAGEDLARTVHSHPTFSEALKEAAMAVRK
jgi:dihydrolipoamide dehydrogenase